MPSPLVLLAVLLAVVVFIPTRRLAVRGASAVTVGGYFLMLWLLSLSVVAVPGRARLLLPIVVIMALIPFVTLREGLDRLFGRPPREVKPPAKNVTPPDAPDASGAGSGPR